LGFADAAACTDWLLSTPLATAQLHTLASHLTIGETYFLRERSTFDALLQSVLPELIRRRRGREQRLRLWSAACSTGEEPYSLAILLRQLLPDWRDWHVTILGTDINERSLQKAAAGLYGEWSFRACPPEFKQSYFTRAADGRFAIAADIRDSVRFAQLNLVQDTFPSLATDSNAMDVILCRNVLMYFTPPQARKLVENLRHALVDEGWLAVGLSECSQALFSRYASLSFVGATLYRKAAVAERDRLNHVPALAGIAGNYPAPVADASAWSSAEATAGAAANDSPPSALAAETLTSAGPIAAVAAAESLYRQGRYREAAELLLPTVVAEVAPSTESAAKTFSLLARALANQGKLAEALEWSKRWIVADTLDPAAHYLHAMVLQELGDGETARRSLLRAIYLQPDFPLAYFALGNLARSQSQPPQASKHFENALELLRRRPPSEPLPESEGMTAGRLIEIITTLLSLPGLRHGKR
jgi:chemotaxis protein methyltransferase CheR